MQTTAQTNDSGHVAGGKTDSPAPKLTAAELLILRLVYIANNTTAHPRPVKPSDKNLAESLALRGLLLAEGEDRYFITAAGFDVHNANAILPLLKVS